MRTTDFQLRSRTELCSLTLVAVLCFGCGDDAKRSDPGKAADAGEMSDASAKTDSGRAVGSDAASDETQSAGRGGMKSAEGDKGDDPDSASGGTDGAAEGGTGAGPVAGASGADTAGEGGSTGEMAAAVGGGSAGVSGQGGASGEAGAGAGGASGAAAGGSGGSSGAGTTGEAGAGAGGASGAAASGSGGSSGAAASGTGGNGAGGASGSGGAGAGGSGGASAGLLCASCGGCEEVFVPSTDNMHTTDPIVYSDPPPTSGPHNPCWARYTVHDTPALPERWVHNLEHGGVVFLYNCPGGCAADVASLTDFVSTRPRTLLTEYSALPGKFAVVSWGHRLVSDCVDPVAFASFYTANFDHGDESEPADPDPACPPDDRLQ